MTTSPFATALGTATTNDTDGESKITHRNLGPDYTAHTRFAIIFYAGKAYLPTEVFSQNHLYWWIEPVYTCDIAVKQICETIKTIQQEKREIITYDKEQEIFKQGLYLPVYKTAGIKTRQRKQFHEDAAVYDISLDRDKQYAVLYLHEPDKKKFGDELIFSYDTPIECLVQMAILDVQKFSSALKK